MEVTVSRRHTEVSESLRLYAEEKIGRLDRFVDGLEMQRAWKAASDKVLARQRGWWRRVVS